MRNKKDRTKKKMWLGYCCSFSHDSPKREKNLSKCRACSCSCPCPPTCNGVPVITSVCRPCSCPGTQITLKGFNLCADQVTVGFVNTTFRVLCPNQLIVSIPNDLVPQQTQIAVSTVFGVADVPFTVT